jgi:S1-C subfamily serine protease
LRILVWFTLSCVTVLIQAPSAHAAKKECLGTPSAPEESVGSVAQRVYRLLVESNRTAVTSGSGFLISGKRVIATNHHVIDGGRKFVAGYVEANGRSHRVGLRVLAYLPQKDLALLEAEEDLPGEALPLKMQLPDYATDLYAIGYPAAADLEQAEGSPVADENFFRPTVIKGSISRIMTGALQPPHRLQLQTSLSPGFSGGPLVDQRGFTIGVGTALNQKVSTIGYGVPAVDLAQLLDACALPLRAVDSGCGTPAQTLAHEGDGLSQPTADGKAPSATEKDLLKRAYDMLRYGDVAGARSTFEYLARARNVPEAYEAWAMTYDRVVLARLDVDERLINEKKAEELYGAARRLRGVQTVSASRMFAGCRNSLCVLLDGKGGESVVVCSRPQG